MSGSCTDQEVKCVCDDTDIQLNGICIYSLYPQTDKQLLQQYESGDYTVVLRMFDTLYTEVQTLQTCVYPQT